MCLIYALTEKLQMYKSHDEYIGYFPAGEGIKTTNMDQAMRTGVFVPCPNNISPCQMETSYIQKHESFRIQIIIRGSADFVKL